MEGDSANLFINSIVKNIQMLCHGHLPFNQNVEVIGHLYLNIDSDKKLNYIVNEKCIKVNASTTFTSNSFHAEPGNVVQAEQNKNTKNISGSTPKYFQNKSRKQKALTILKSEKSPKLVKLSDSFEDSETPIDCNIDNSLGVTFSQDSISDNPLCLQSSIPDTSIVKTEAEEVDEFYHIEENENDNDTSLDGGGANDILYPSRSLPSLPVLPTHSPSGSQYTSTALDEDDVTDTVTRFKYLYDEMDFESESSTTDGIDAVLPKNTQKRNKWAVNTYKEWAIWRNEKNDEANQVTCQIETMIDSELNFWLSRFIVEVRKKTGEMYPPNSIFSLIMGLAAHIKLTSKRNLDIFRNPIFEEFRLVLDGRTKKLTDLGLGQKRHAEPITTEDEEKFWELGLLGSHHPRVLINTIIYLNGRNFFIRSGNEHRALRFKDSQISLIEPCDSIPIPFLQYQEDTSKAQGKHRRNNPKIIKHYASSNKERCHVELYKKYMDLSPKDDRDDAFYLTPLQLPNDRFWYSRQPMGHNTLQKLVPSICEQAGITGHKTNHSLTLTAIDNGAFWTT